MHPTRETRSAAKRTGTLESQEQSKPFPKRQRQGSKTVVPRVTPVMTRRSRALLACAEKNKKVSASPQRQEMAGSWMVKSHPHPTSTCTSAHEGGAGEQNAQQDEGHSPSVKRVRKRLCFMESQGSKVHEKDKDKEVEGAKDGMSNRGGAEEQDGSLETRDSLEGDRNGNVGAEDAANGNHEALSPSSNLPMKSARCMDDQNGDADEMTDIDAAGVQSGPAASDQASASGPEGNEALGKNITLKEGANVSKSHPSSHDTSSHDTSSHDTSSHDTSSHDTSSHDTSSHDTSSHDTSSHHISSHDTSCPSLSCGKSGPDQQDTPWGLDTPLGEVPLLDESAKQSQTQIPTHANGQHHHPTQRGSGETPPPEITLSPPHPIECAKYPNPQPTEASPPSASQVESCLSPRASPNRYTEPHSDSKQPGTPSHAHQKFPVPVFGAHPPIKSPLPIPQSPVAAHPPRSPRSILKSAPPSPSLCASPKSVSFHITETERPLQSPSPFRPVGLKKAKLDCELEDLRKELEAKKLAYKQLYARHQNAMQEIEICNAQNKGLVKKVEGLTSKLKEVQDENEVLRSTIDSTAK